MSGLIQSVEPGSVAERAGLQAGDTLTALNGHRLHDVIDAQFYGAEDDLVFEYERGGQPVTARAGRDFGQPLGLAFAHPTFDVDIRRCNNLCPFCFVLQNAPRLRRALYIKDDDYRYSFLFGHFVTLTNLAAEDWARIAEQRLTPLYVSVHATDPDIRRQCLRNPKAPDVMEQLRWLGDHGIQAHTQLVVTPGLNDGAQAEKSVFDLAGLYPRVQSVSVVPVGLTRYHKYGHRPNTVAEANAMLDAVQSWQRTLRGRIGAGFVHASDEWYLVTKRALPSRRAYENLALQENGLGMVRGFLNEWQRLKRTELAAPGTRGAAGRGHLRDWRYPSATLATATLFAPILTRAAREFTERTGVPLNVVAIRNERLGETITVAGLLMGQDVMTQLAALDLPASGIVILPRIMFDHPDGMALDDVMPRAIARALNRPVALADWMGDVLDALAGRNRLTFEPGEG